MRYPGARARATLTALERSARPLRVRAPAGGDRAPRHRRLSRSMIPLALELGRVFRVHAPDLPGFGLSEHPAEMLDVSGLADAFIAWCDDAGLERPVTVAGGFGCHVAAGGARSRARPL